MEEIRNEFISSSKRTENAPTNQKPLKTALTDQFISGAVDIFLLTHRISRFFFCPHFEQN